MICSKCQCDKEVTEFFKDKQRKSGYQRYCKRCSMDTVNKRNSGNWEFYFKGLLGIRKHLKHGLTVENLLSLYKEQQGLCALTGKELTSIKGQGKVATNCSIDRIQNGGDYVLSNVRLVCCAANEMRNNRTDNELFEWCEAILKGRNGS